ncbi:MAG: hypothetical protein KF687_06600 [Cyclobacteriaceae bacterium]|nr:hypothetical protein [Cyclobacteriaceae bacterium]
MKKRKPSKQAGNLTKRESNNRDSKGAKPVSFDHDTKFKLQQRFNEEKEQAEKIAGIKSNQVANGLENMTEFERDLFVRLTLKESENQWRKENQKKYKRPQKRNRISPEEKRFLDIKDRINPKSFGKFQIALEELGLDFSPATYSRLWNKYYKK